LFANRPGVCESPRSILDLWQATKCRSSR
jgi:hypothetical protein